MFSLKEFEISYTFGKSLYVIKVHNPRSLNSGSLSIEIDGAIFKTQELTLVDDGHIHQINVTITSIDELLVPLAPSEHV